MVVIWLVIWFVVFGDLRVLRLRLYVCLWLALVLLLRVFVVLRFVFCVVVC